MDALTVVLDGLGRVRFGLERSLRGVSNNTLNQIPDPGSNSMAWLGWHLTRVQDHHLSDLAGIQQVWITDKWHQRFNMDADQYNTGFGHSPDEVSNLSPISGDLLLGYHLAVYARTEKYISGIDAGELDRVLDEPQWDPRPTVGVRLVSVINDNTQHVGQMAYIRGLIEGRGWMQYPADTDDS